MNRPKASFLRQSLSALFLGIIVVLLLLVFWVAGSHLLFANRIFPGVSLNGISLGGMTEREAMQTIASNYSFPQTGHILLQAGDGSWLVSPAQLGVYVDTQATADKALSIGRKNPVEIMEAAMFGAAVSPAFVFDQNVALQYLEGLSASINQPVKEANLSIANAQVSINQGQPGRVLDMAASLQSISIQITKMQDGIVPLSVTEVQPKILDVSKQGDELKTILSQPLTLSLPAEANSPAAGPWTIAPADLAGLLNLTETGTDQSATLAVQVNQPLVTAYLQTLKKQIDQSPQNSRFIFNDETKQLDLYQKAAIGRSLDIDKSVAAINDALLKGDHSATLSLEIVKPAAVDTSTAADLGITQLVQEYTSYFHSSPDGRVQNIQTAAKQFLGLLVAPGETLSMADILGDISLDSGYAEAPIILGDQTISGIGGGVCQVSTTLFRTVFLAGYQIDERHPHAYRVGYYDQINSAGLHSLKYAGLDATVFVPLVDFKFTNNSNYWILMETYVSTANNSLTWKIYSTPDGRTVNWQSSGLTNIVDPPASVYVENPDLPAGTIKQTDYAVQGATVRVDRTVTLNGNVIISDHFDTKYEAWPDIYDYGPGTEIPTPVPTP